MSTAFARRERCAKSLAEIAAIPELNAIIKSSKPNRDGVLPDLLGGWKTNVLGTTVKISFESEESGFRSAIKIGDESEQVSSGASICYAGRNTVYVLGGDGVVKAFIKVINTYDPHRPQRSGKVDVQIAEAKKNRDKLYEPKQYYTFKKSGSVQVAQTVLVPQAIRSTAGERADGAN